MAKWECWSSDPSHVYFHTAAVISPTHNLLWWKNIWRVKLEIQAEGNFQKKLYCSEEEVCCCHCCVIIGQSCHFWAVTVIEEVSDFWAVTDSDRRGLSQVNWGGIEKFQWLLWYRVNYYFRKNGFIAALFEKWTQLDNCSHSHTVTRRILWWKSIRRIRWRVGEWWVFGVARFPRVRDQSEQLAGCSWPAEKRWAPANLKNHFPAVMRIHFCSSNKGGRL